MSSFFLSFSPPSFFPYFLLGFSPIWKLLLPEGCFLHFLTFLNLPFLFPSFILKIKDKIISNFFISSFPSFSFFLLSSFFLSMCFYLFIYYITFYNLFLLFFNFTKNWWWKGNLLLPHSTGEPWWRTLMENPVGPWWGLYLDLDRMLFMRSTFRCLASISWGLSGSSGSRSKYRSGIRTLSGIDSYNNQKKKNIKCFLKYLSRSKLKKREIKEP